MAKFEELLLERLKQHKPAPAAALPARRRLTPVVVAAMAVLAALVAVVVPSLGEDGATAHAVTRNPDGTVSISGNDLRDIDAANRGLRDLGVTNIVFIALSESGSCAPEDRPGPDILPPLGMWMREADSVATIRPELIPRGTTMLFFGSVPTGDTVTVLIPRLVATQERYCDELPR
jgi:hypothetical protein